MWSVGHRGPFPPLCVNVGRGGETVVAPGVVRGPATRGHLRQGAVVSTKGVDTRYVVSLAEIINTMDNGSPKYWLYINRYI